MELKHQHGSRSQRFDNNREVAGGNNVEHVARMDATGMASGMPLPRQKPNPIRTARFKRKENRVVRSSGSLNGGEQKPTN